MFLQFADKKPICDEGKARLEIADTIDLLDLCGRKLKAVTSHNAVYKPLFKGLETR